MLQSREEKRGGLLLILFLQSMTVTYEFLYGFLTKRELKGIEREIEMMK
jgi:hypothetical protein